MKLTKLPDRKPIKLVLMITADLHRQLKLYTGLYRNAYAEEVSIGDLVPFMLENFLKSDPAFIKAKRKEKI